jgi:hypothetical protein
MFIVLMLGYYRIYLLCLFLHIHINLLNYLLFFSFPTQICITTIGRFPKEIHLFCDQYKLSDVPTDSQALTAWLYDIFLKKEKRIDQFNEKLSKSTTSSSTASAASDVATSINKLPLFESYSLIASSHTSESGGSMAASPSSLFILFISLSMIALILAVFYSLIYYPLFRYYMALVSALTVLCSVVGNGWDIIELAIYDKFISSSNNDDHID